MFKTLVYNGKEYEQFGIDIFGNVINRKTDHIYKLSKSSAGYLNVYLPMGERGKVKVIRVHKAVAETFIPNPNNLPVVNHIDENRGNPCVWNLEWTTHKGNTQAHWKKMNERTPYFNNRKLTYEQVVQLREDAKHMGCRRLAKKYNISHVTAKNIAIGKLYADGF